MCTCADVMHADTCVHIPANMYVSAYTCVHIHAYMRTHIYIIYVRVYAAIIAWCVVATFQDELLIVSILC